MSACRCFVDAIITGSDSKFMDRTAENKLQFQLEAFRFQGAESGLVSTSDWLNISCYPSNAAKITSNNDIYFPKQLYITCHLKATTTAYAIDSYHRACSHISG